MMIIMKMKMMMHTFMERVIPEIIVTWCVVLLLLFLMKVSPPKELHHINGKNERNEQTTVETNYDQSITEQTSNLKMNHYIFMNLLVTWFYILFIKMHIFSSYNS